jgi:glycosyltransferase involved in cell wall biosynthesis
MHADHPRLCFVGHMLSRQPGHVTGQSEILADLFEQAGYSVIAVSSRLNRLARMTDTLLTLLHRRKEFDIAIIDVFSYRSFLLSDLASKAARIAGKPVILFLHGGSLPEFFAKYPDRAKKVLGRACQLLAPSRYLARAVEPLQMQAEVIPNVLDLSLYPYRKRMRLQPRLFWMRAFHELYHPEMAVQVIHRLHEELPDVSLTMAGQDKGLLETTRRLAERLGVGERVRFVGFLDSEGKAREGDAADIFLNTNRVDNMPVSVVEACAMGLPVVATAVGGIPDLLTQEKTGLLVADGDVEAMAQAVVRLLREPELAQRLSDGGRELALESSWERVRLRWEQVFARIQGESRAAI